MDSRGDVAGFFRMFDKNEDGKIPIKALCDSLSDLLGVSSDDSNLLAEIENFDKDGDGYIDQEEFVSLMERPDSSLVDEDAELRSAFGVFDRNSDGLISADELHHVLCNLNLKPRFSLEDCMTMIKSVDADGDGMIDLDEFRKMMPSGGFSSFGSRP